MMDGDPPNANKFNLKNPFKAKKKRQRSKVKACIQQPTCKKRSRGKWDVGSGKSVLSKKEKAKL
jgi:hypothetical protein